MVKKNVRGRSISFPLAHSDGRGQEPASDPIRGRRAQAVLYADTHESRAYAILLSILAVGAVFVSLVVGSGKTALAASAGGNDPGASTFAANCATRHAQNGGGELASFGSVAETDRDLLEWNYGDYEGRIWR